ncbi:unnamed protein product [Umbelopsis vinacea]|jgi:hypothetical protein
MDDTDFISLVGEHFGKIAKELGKTEEANKNLMKTFICVAVALGSCNTEGDTDYKGLQDRLLHLLTHVDDGPDTKL